MIRFDYLFLVLAVLFFRMAYVLVCRGVKEHKINCLFAGLGLCFVCALASTAYISLDNEIALGENTISIPSTMTNEEFLQLF